MSLNREQLLSDNNAEANRVLLAYGLEMRQDTPTLHDNVKIMGGTYYGSESVYCFEKRFSEQFAAHPDHIHILSAFGEPGSGKTSLLDELIDRQKSKGMQEGYKFRVINLPWGDVFHHIPKSKRVTGVNYHEDEELFAAKRREIDEANRIYKGALLQALGMERRPGIVDIVSTDLPALSGMVLPDGEVLGIPRGYQLLRELGSASGEFSRFEGAYTHFGIGMVATNEIRGRSRNTRATMLSYSNPEDITSALAEQGIIFTAKGPEQIVNYQQEVASPSEMNLFEKDIYYFVRALTEHGFTSTDERLGRIRTSSLVDYESFTLYDQQRVDSIGQGLLPRLMEDYGIPDDQAIIIVNDMLLERTMILLDVETVRPLVAEL